MLATGLVPAAVLLVLRHRTPETPRWLMLNGRQQEASDSWRHAQGLDDSATPSERARKRPHTGRHSAAILFRRPLFVVLFAMAFYWMCNNLYGSAILLYQAKLINELVTPSTYTTLLFTGLANLLAVLFGLFICFRVIEARGRRPVALLGTSTFAVALVVVGLFIDQPYVALVAYVTALVVTNGCTSLSYYAWAPELFPTSVRGRAVGLINTCGKLGSVVGTFALPLAFEHLHGYAFLLLAGLAVVNVVVTYRLAPETARRSLQELEEQAGERMAERTG